jgi:integrase
MTPETTPEAALAWAKRNKGRILAAGSRLTLAPFLDGFFDRSGPWVTRMTAKGHSFGDKYLATRQAHLDLYIKPIFGPDDPREIRGRDIDDRLLAAPRAKARTGEASKPLAPGTKYKILYSFALVLSDLAERGIIERNPLEGIRSYSKAPVAPRDALPREALEKLFPASHGELVRVWGSSLWASLMLVLIETGLRPGEARALRWQDLHEEGRAVIARHGIQAGTTATVKGTKTGIVRAGGLSLRTAQELEIWKRESRHAAPGDFVFTLDGEAPVTDTSVIKAFKRGLEQAGIEGTSWTPYWLRHTFVTHSLATLDDSELLMLAGHTNITTNAIYRHPDDAVVLKRSAGARAKLDAGREEAK